MSPFFIEIILRTGIDSGEILGMMQGGDALGSWEEDGILHIYWPEEKWSPVVLEDLKQSLTRLGIKYRDAGLTVNAISDRDWNAVWAASLYPIRVGKRFRIRQSWHAADPTCAGFELVIDPKRAFGTGYHPTTQLVMEWLEDRIEGGEHVMDIGTGSGILAMAAIRLGAASVLAIDNDPVAIECAREYAGANGFGPELEFRVASFDATELRGFDRVLANLDIRTLPALCELLPRVLNKGALACLSGLQNQDYEEISRCLSRAGLAISSLRDRDNWLALEVMRKNE
jgi:ribosomal protein L11 methyltransferase